MKKVVAQKRNSFSLAENKPLKSGSDIILKKELNIYGKIGLVLISGFFIASGLSLFANEREKREELEFRVAKLKEYQEGLIKVLSSKISESEKRHALVVKNNSDEVYQELKKEIQNTKRTREDGLSLYKNEFLKMKAEVESLKQIVAFDLVKKRGEDRVLTYNQKNFEILFFKHRLILKRLKEKQDEKRKSFVKLYPDLKKYREFEDSLTLEYYTKKAELREQRRRFENEKVIKLNQEVARVSSYER